MTGLRLLDRYLLRMSLGTLASVIAIVMSLMVLEHLPRLIDLTDLSGHRGYIVGQTILGLLPEYAGIGTVFGLFLAIGLTIRKLAVRSELDAIEAMGIAPRRWMRMPLLLTLLAALFVFVNQSWLMPAGESRIDDIGRRMVEGDFGFSLSANEFHPVTDELVFKFEGIDPADGRLTGIFVRSSAGVFQAASGYLSLSEDRDVVLSLRNGQLIEPGGRVMSFAAFDVKLPRSRRFDTGSTTQDAPARGRAIEELFSSGDPVDLRAALARLLWVVVTLLVPFIALSLARPPMRSTSALGIFLGLCLIVVLIKMIDWYSGLSSDYPAVEAATVVAVWLGMARLAGTRRESGKLVPNILRRMKTAFA